MKIAEKLIAKEEVSQDELKYALWMALCQLMLCGADEVSVDPNESFDAEAALEALESMLDMP